MGAYWDTPWDAGDVPISGGTALEGLDTDGVDTGYHPVVGWYELIILQ